PLSTASTVFGTDNWRASSAIGTLSLSTAAAAAVLFDIDGCHCDVASAASPSPTAARGTTGTWRCPNTTSNQQQQQHQQQQFSNSGHYLLILYWGDDLSTSTSLSTSTNHDGAVLAQKTAPVGAVASIAPNTARSAANSLTAKMSSPKRKRKMDEKKTAAAAATSVRISTNADPTKQQPPTLLSHQQQHQMPDLNAVVDEEENEPPPVLCRVVNRSEEEPSVTTQSVESVFQREAKIIRERMFDANGKKFGPLKHFIDGFEIEEDIEPFACEHRQLLDRLKREQAGLEAEIEERLSSKAASLKSDQHFAGKKWTKAIQNFFFVQALGGVRILPATSNNNNISSNTSATVATTSASFTGGTFVDFYQPSAQAPTMTEQYLHKNGAGAVASIAPNTARSAGLIFYF
uniref:GLTSCR1 domain-containing protein n=1 Tax=Globodera pallida TaxID=36090 RepID=A0A183CQT5_GLOPA